MCNKTEQGNILVSALLLLVAMTLMATGILQTASRESTQATYKTVDSEVFHITDSCTHDVITWFETLTATPTTLQNITVSSLDSLMTGSETTVQQNKLSGYGYGCVLSYLTSKNVAAGTGVGGDVSGSGSEYGGTSGEVLVDYYKIVATGTGPNNAQKTLNTIISVQY